MTNIVVVDSSALVSLFSPDDSNHQIAKKLSLTLKNQNTVLIVPGEIFTETVNVFGKKISHEIATKYGSFILTRQEYTIAETNHLIRGSAFEKFQDQPKSVSFTDCLVMAFADDYETREIFGFDDAFRKNGYIRFGVDNLKNKSSK
ncbi:hypothetical protein A3A60_03865 [Candidatus Curtissbacteria bacterium RIFCSPLOWO2_01_FULL_42_26]|uniref:PIN domain-containing protein n=1 Tax=Candidatus Curtissbacteria bacterium RIFCSPLOWO2_01_FULL_42_26 TaxID=1797729 RepID=A0A1F5I0Q8_9BACT|nr:MAG: hypothetical protein A3A60_03865 [Candidatus Curtissbacteria bacterium RIFCSPLOWO2_01_FULL_42_26]